MGLTLFRKKCQLVLDGERARFRGSTGDAGICAFSETSSAAVSVENHLREVGQLVEPNGMRITTAKTVVREFPKMISRLNLLSC